MIEANCHITESKGFISMLGSPDCQPKKITPIKAGKLLKLKQDAHRQFR
jgi:hypothetical protein